MGGSVYAIAGGKGGVGKTATTANVAVALAEAGYEVAAVDVDLGMTNLGQTLGITRSEGIHEVLAGEAALADVRCEGPAGVQVVPGGDGVPATTDADPAKIRSVVDPLLADVDIVLLDTGAGVGSEALYWQDRFETVAIDISAHLVETMRDRGVENPMQADMFALRESFERDRFGSVHAAGTQLGLAGSMHGLRRFLGDLDAVTTPDATAVVDCHDPEHERASELFGYRPDPAPGLAYRAFHFEYEGDVGETLLFRLFSPDRLREAAIGTGWEVTAIRRSDDGYHYQAALTAV